jgi:hypothetical protein
MSLEHPISIGEATRGTLSLHVVARKCKAGKMETLCFHWIRDSMDLIQETVPRFILDDFERG